MRVSMLLAIGLVMGVVPTASAVTLKDCSKGTTEQRLVCLQANIVALNSSHEIATTELRGAVKDLITKVDTLTGQVSTLTGQVNDLKGQIPNLDNVVIQWAVRPNDCMGVEGGDTHIRYFETCKDSNRNRFVIRPYQP